MDIYIYEWMHGYKCSIPYTSLRLAWLSLDWLQVFYKTWCVAKSMECHRINGKIWVIQISYFIQIHDHQSTIGNTSCPWKVLDPSKLATVLGSLPIWPKGLLPSTFTYLRHREPRIFFRPRGGVRWGKSKPLSRWQEHKKQFWAKVRRIPSPLDPGSQFFSVAPTKKWADFCWADNPNGWRSKWNGWRLQR